MNDFSANQKSSELLLPPMLAEFRDALKDEIEVAKRNSSSGAIPLSNGSRIGQQGSLFHYSFSVDSVLNAPDDAPGDLIVPGRAPMEATKISGEGLRLVIGVAYDLGAFVPTARLVTNLTMLMRKLIERIEVNAGKENPAAERMLGNAPVVGYPQSPLVTPSVPLNERQLSALKSALGRNLTAIWGPPGTGKTRTIGTIAQSLMQERRSVLVVSHTNTAVDQAIMHVATAIKSSDPKQLEDGAVVRIGKVSDEKLIKEYPEVLIEYQVARQSKDLVDQRSGLVKQKQGYEDQLYTLQSIINVIKWATVMAEELVVLESDFIRLNEMEEELSADTKMLDELHLIHADLLETHKKTARILEIRKKKDIGNEERERLAHLLNRIVTAQKQAESDHAQQKERVALAQRTAPIRQERKKYPKTDEQKAIAGALSAKAAELDKLLSEKRNNHAFAVGVLNEAEKTTAMGRLLKRLPNPEKQKIIADELAKNICSLDGESASLKQACETAAGKLGKILEMDAELLRHSDIGTPESELQQLDRLGELIQGFILKRAPIEAKIQELDTDAQDFLAEEVVLCKSIVGDIKEQYAAVCSKLQKYKELQSSLKERHSDIKKFRKTAELKFKSRLSEAIQFELVSQESDDLGEMLSELREAQHKSSTQYPTTELSLFEGQVEGLTASIHTVNMNISVIDGKLAEVERAVIANASIIGATLTKVYLSDDIQERKFDTVILDEASMAPIPALWVAALLAEKNLVLVGDFRQLPPIVLSAKESTQKWLGRDVFEASGLQAAWESGQRLDHFILLNEQRRMFPEIAEVANRFYDGNLSTPVSVPNKHDEFLAWYNSDWPHDGRVVLVDTESLNAWVTSVAKGGSSSRINFLSATVAVDLAEQLLRADRPKAPKRILIVTPYRAQAKLLKILLSEMKLEDEVIAGTAHSFQGSEADVVIFDLVVDEPHWRVRLFDRNPDVQKQVKRLLNVGLTRAKFRLFVLGDFSYCQAVGKKSYLGNDLIPFLLKTFPKIDASQLVPEGLAAKAAKAQMTMLGGEIEPDSARIVVTQTDFFRLLASDLSRARSRVIIYSPFITQDRLTFLMPQMQAAIQRGVLVFVITKPHSERTKSEISQIRRLETQLSEIGVIVMHKMRMHEKLVFIDDDILWTGSLNLTSFSNTQEIMERRKSRAVFDDYFQVLRVEDLMGGATGPESRCPICGSEMVAAEGLQDPFYWRCINDDCYSRSIGQPYPFDGILRCSSGSCNSAVEFGFWGDEPHWRCIENKQHRQKIFKSHLRLPKMAALIPKKEYKKVCKLLGIEAVEDLSASFSIPQAQMELFNE
jgi:hypothetical protein